MTVKPRLSYEPGHRPKFLAIVDETPECGRAVYFAARRASRIGAGLVLLAVAEASDYGQHWLGVGDLIRAEAEDTARQLLERLAEQAQAIIGVAPEKIVRSGAKSEEILALIDEDRDISFLVLAAAADSDGPGPIISSLIGSGSGSFPIPIVIVPGALSDADIDALA